MPFDLVKICVISNMVIPPTLGVLAAVLIMWAMFMDLGTDSAQFIAGCACIAAGLALSGFAIADVIACEKEERRGITGPG